jgi:hypothetical protein
VTRSKPAKNHSAKVLTESAVISLTINPRPRPRAAWNRRKVFHGGQVRSVDSFPRQHSPTMASSGAGRPRSAESFFILPRFHLGALCQHRARFLDRQKKVKEMGLLQHGAVQRFVLVSLGLFHMLIMVPNRVFLSMPPLLIPVALRLEPAVRLR